MHYHQLQVTKKQSKKRVGRGISAGQGKTAGRGTKGQNARTGGKRRPGFEGGQTPLMIRLPKLRGFTSHAPKTESVYTGQLNNLGKKVTNKTVYEAGLVSSPYVNVKVIVNGDITKPVEVILQNASATAEKAISKAGGSFTKIDRQPRPASSKKESK